MSEKHQVLTQRAAPGLIRAARAGAAGGPNIFHNTLAEQPPALT